MDRPGDEDVGILGLMKKVGYLAVCAMALAACHSSSLVAATSPLDSASPTATSSASAISSVTVSPTRPATPSAPLPTSGAPSSSCLHGWKSPKPGSALFQEPLKVIQNTVPVKGKLVVVEMRYFVGPESPPSDKVEILSVQRWYVKLYVARDWRFQGRFLVEKRVFGSGVSAVAAYDTTGFNSPDWTGFKWNSEDLTRHAYPGLPGLWPGTAYDFVKGSQGVRVQGLPDQELGCMAGT